MWCFLFWWQGSKKCKEADVFWAATCYWNWQLNSLKTHECWTTTEFKSNVCLWKLTAYIALRKTIITWSVYIVSIYDIRTSHPFLPHVKLNAEPVLKILLYLKKQGYMCAKERQQGLNKVFTFKRTVHGQNLRQNSHSLSQVECMWFFCVMWWSVTSGVNVCKVTSSSTSQIFLKIINTWWIGSYLTSVIDDVVSKNSK